MRSPFGIRIQHVIGLSAFLIISGCETFDPVEPAPSFIRISDFDFVTTDSQGDAAERIEDVWVLSGEETIGVFPLSSKIPLLVDGPTDISIRPGIRINGISSARAIYQYYTSFDTTVYLIPGGSPVQIHPVFGFNQFADFAFHEDFDGPGLELTATDFSETEVQTTSDPEIAYSGPSGYFLLQGDQRKFECKSEKFNLPGSGNVVILEFNYKGNTPLTIGTFVYNPGQTIQSPVLTLNSSDEWKRIYVNLTEKISGNPNNTGVEVFFGMIRDESAEGDSEVYIDNIKLVY